MSTAIAYKLIKAIANLLLHFRWACLVFPSCFLMNSGAKLITCFFKSDHLLVEFYTDLIKNFWEWLVMLEMFALAAWEINRIRECVWNLVNLGDRIFSQDNNNSGVVIEKNITPEKTKALQINWGQNISLEDPAYVIII